MNVKQKTTFSLFARWAAVLTGHPLTFALAVLIVLTWALTGPLFNYSDTWQLAINTGTTIVTFLMVFLIQNSQNRDTITIHVKLDELIRAVTEARNSVIDLEDIDEAELKTLLAQYRQLAKAGRRDEDGTASTQNAARPASGTMLGIPRSPFPAVVPRNT